MSVDDVVTEFTVSLPAQGRDSVDFAVGFLTPVFSLLAVVATISFFYKYLSE